MKQSNHFTESCLKYILSLAFVLIMLGALMGLTVDDIGEDHLLWVASETILVFGWLLVLSFAVIWVATHKSRKIFHQKISTEEISSAEIRQSEIRNFKFLEIGIEQKKPENKFYVTAKPSIYFDGQKIIIKSTKNDELIKSIKGLDRRAWDPVLIAWVCPVGEFAGVLGISKRYNIPLDETFVNMHAGTDIYADPLIPGSNSGMVKLHNDGTLSLSTKRLMKIDEGYVYMIHDKVQNLYKIGKSITPEKRVKAIMGSLPMETEAIHCAWFEDHGYAEQLFHGMFSAKRKGGEWFALDEEDIGLIKSLGQKHDLNPTEEQLEEKARTEEKRKENYKQFKQREQRRNSQYSTSRKNKNNPNRW